MEMLAPPICLICKKGISEGIQDNPALAAFAEAVHAGETCAGFPALSHSLDSGAASDGPRETTTHTDAVSTIVCVGAPVLVGKSRARAKVAESSPRPAKEPGTSPCSCHSGAAAHLFCVIDSVAVCSACVQEAHAAHELIPVTNAAAHLFAKVVSVMSNCNSAAASLAASADQLMTIRARMVARKAAAVKQLLADAAELKQALDARVAAAVATVDKALKASLKAIDAQIDEMCVTSNQLACTVSLCSRTLTAHSESPVELATALRSACATSKLVRYEVPPIPAANTLIDVVSTLPALTASISDAVKTFIGVSPTQSTLTGTGLMNVSCSDNIINRVAVTVKDDAGRPVETLTTNDVVVRVVPKLAAVAGSGSDGAGALSPLPRKPVEQLCTVTVVPNKRKAGVFDVTYTAPPASKLVTIDVAVAGTRLADCPRSIVANLANLKASVVALPVPRNNSFAASGALSRTLELNSAESAQPASIAVSNDGMLIVVVFVVKDRQRPDIRVFDQEGDVIGTLKPYGRPRPDQYYAPTRACFTSRNEFLVADHGTDCIVHCTLNCEVVRLIPCVAVCAVAASKDCIIAANCRATGFSVELIDFSSTAVLRRFGSGGSGVSSLAYCDAVAVSPSGKYVLVADRINMRIAVFSLPGGTFVRAIGMGVVGKGRLDLEFTAAGEIVVSGSDKRAVFVFSADGATMLRKWDLDIAPVGISVYADQLYCLSDDEPKILCYK